jgi:hypothetical protein
MDVGSFKGGVYGVAFDASGVAGRLKESGTPSRCFMTSFFVEQRQRRMAGATDGSARNRLLTQKWIGH